jgi:hypothetical protein
MGQRCARPTAIRQYVVQVSADASERTGTQSTAASPNIVRKGRPKAGDDIASEYQAPRSLDDRPTVVEDAAGVSAGEAGKVTT